MKSKTNFKKLLSIAPACVMLVVVGDESPYRAGKTQNGYVILGDNNTKSYHKEGLTQSYDFDKDYDLMATGIYNHIHYSYE